MADLPPTGAPGVFEARYLAFLETIAHLRPGLHRYCARMTGSVMDGEDIVQEALFQAYRKLESFDEDRPLAPWLFRIAHNRCIDFLRRESVRKGSEAGFETTDSVLPVEPAGPALGRAVEHLVVTLPPMERACVLLKDVFDYSLEEIADFLDSTIGGVKAALNRGRSRLANSHDLPVGKRRPDPTATRLLQLYVERFNRRDWDAVRDLIAEDAHLRVADRFAGPLKQSPYFARYEQRPFPWRMSAGELDGEAAVFMLTQQGDEWLPQSVVRLDISEGRIAGVVDYTHCGWMLRLTHASVSFSDCES